MRKRKIAVLTGKRGGFGALIGVMQLIERDPSMELILIVTDMHLSSYFGYTVKEVKKFFPVSYKLHLQQEGDSGMERANALGRCIIKAARAFKKIKPDILLTLGDRGEVLSACIAAMELGIPIAHILGGDITGNRDGSRIHSITKLANLHFPSSKHAYNRIIKLGEEPWRVYDVGSSYVDFIAQKRYTPNNLTRKKYKIGPEEDYFICIQHPMTFQEKGSYDETLELLAALSGKKTKTLVIYPCSDQGYEGVIRAIKKYERVPYFDVYKNIEALDFWGLMSGASLFIGNSSAGLMETPYFGLPTVNVGRRQQGRIRDNNVIDTNPKRQKISKAIDEALSKKFKSQIKNNYIFGRGHASEKIVRVLRTVNLDDKLLMKKITY